MQRRRKRLFAAPNQHAIIEQLLVAVSSVPFARKIKSEDQREKGVCELIREANSLLKNDKRNLSLERATRNKEKKARKYLKKNSMKWNENLVSVLRWLPDIRTG
jgi:hypothetical protein